MRPREATRGNSNVSVPAVRILWGFNEAAGSYPRKLLLWLSPLRTHESFNEAAGSYPRKR